ncbi:TPA: hypothetical protein DDW69_03760 [candidate division CPR2 bacterium]|uniref:Putative membrane protein n=1 Tax=candidate division CPR2 bacterium GW2011_GWC1_41_48 TaxID=1618344 RepID=A0A0G0Z7H0_UNCC2|nr:MAG: putative membrane protein [candidate division CPR2 bacterium GW2011_GWC2_39_35]KKR28827.1 MAG: putative membrane protein [candidate division CPR2 bacterium GW2011_GWD1_39_7]KKR29338.1 MAG: putative membrane protein [candidate division CPR2 bacterium GW2011_GWD2_39_7]KKS08993.1 MAG: putative membrane protein [candidate division CPR2 bacterium GW2011_GWC1_41_48]OGB61436.1 MAG: hypothetical protein A2Y27_03750 [candidate division CPR2 bacterium GWD1_39_7]OGB71161.1 MAG: hypothetical prote
MIHYQKKKNGFTIIEALIAISLIGIITVYIIPVYLNSIQANRKSANKTKAVNRALAQIEEYRRKDYASIPENLTSFNIPELKLPEGKGEMFVTEDTSLNIKKVEITIKWKEKNKNEQIVIPTYIADKGVF